MIGRTFKTDIADYETARPDYPPQITEWLNDEFSVNETSTILELGAGSGKLTPRIIASQPKEIIAVDTYVEMLDVLKKKFPNVDCRVGSAMAIPLEDESVDLVACGQCFHWFANEEALKEIYRVLKPNGKLALIWNIRDNSVPWVEKCSQLLEKCRGGPLNMFEKAAELFPGYGFTELKQSLFTSAKKYSIEDLHRLMNSFSSINRLPVEEKEKMHAELDEIIKTIPRAQNTDQVDFNILTVAYSSEKVPIN
ncbi:Methyltransferase [Schizosaccharomyces pombe]|uniref:Uncharacterized methyltransferase C25B8.09 n=1 Tax=Schizosaccharomyces pombe (strain 972 / ATCC 24843) TaxID=284812 RepID=YL89_SCHPO|nr:putative trans-aconitate 3-methyltransferase [Schizosaccharomyces pombe]Q9UTA9.1 RecName: Full=Uncharacterized methyltransferase C25B8.09 [Schizosaccharomyces pombe 972h-]CAB61775.1 trans-aconitate 3-methyltransferase (predicted) [Schizosaccharomyces pombe]|eukprot:NP_594469.1 putative trans-aconitate 3-methyltransferase [Schizosaccharomyces pombe]